MDNLPNEVLLEIMSYFRSQISINDDWKASIDEQLDNRYRQEILYHLIFVNRTFRSAATKVLYHTIDLRGYNARLYTSLLLTRTFVEQPGLAKLVRRVLYHSSLNSIDEDALDNEQQYEFAGGICFLPDRQGPTFATVLNQMVPAVKRLSLKPYTKRILTKKLKEGMPEAVFALCFGLCSEIEMLEIKMPLGNLIMRVVRELSPSRLSRVHIANDQFRQPVLGTKVLWDFLRLPALTTFAVDYVNLAGSVQFGNAADATFKLRHLHIFHSLIRTEEWQALCFPRLRTLHVIFDQARSQYDPVVCYEHLGNWVRALPALKKFVMDDTQLDAPIEDKGDKVIGSLATTSLQYLDINVDALVGNHTMVEVSVDLPDVANHMMNMPRLCEILPKTLRCLIIRNSEAEPWFEPRLDQEYKQLMTDQRFGRLSEILIDESEYNWCDNVEGWRSHEEDNGKLLVLTRKAISH